MTRHLVVEADGGSRGNPGVAGYGALVRDGATGRVLAERAAPLGKASNNVAEYQGLIAGLQAVLDLDLAADAQVEVLMDSKLVVEQMSGRWKIKHQDMRRLALEATDLAQQIGWQGGAVSYRWIPREQNGAADALSNKGMDGEHVATDMVTDEGNRLQEEGSAPDAAGDGADEPTFGDSRTPVSDLVFSDETTPTLEGSCRLVLVRHGVTDYTVAHRLDGRGGANPPLNERGLAQAQAAAGAVATLLERSEPGPVQVVTSSLRRAQQTGGAIAARLGIEPRIDRDWDEQSFGDWDGRTLEELVADDGADLLKLRQELDFARPGGESRSDLISRVDAALGRAVAQGGIVVVATHRMPLMCVLARVLGLDHERAWLVATAPASLTAIEVWPDGGVQVAFVNDTHHLHALER